MKILFVDDEFILLEGLQLRLAPLCQDWEMEFAESGADALARVSATAFDAVVADWQMPGMSGPALLDEVMERSPQTVRILLADPGECGEAEASSDASLHEIVSKVCAPEELKAAILRVCGKEDEAQSGKLEDLMARVTRLPSIPSLYLELMDLMKNPDSELDDIGAVIAKDMTMTAAVLKMANSAFFGLQRVVTNTTEATMYLGIDTLRSLVLSAQIFSQFESQNLGAFSVDALFKHSLGTAAAAKAIARAEGAGKTVSDEAFVAGVLHDIGKLVLASNFPEEYDRVLALVSDEGMEDCEAEREVFGVTHADVGGRLLRLWALPLAVVEAVALHHEPARAKKKAFSSLTATHAANGIIEQARPNDGEAPLRLDMDYLNALGLGGRIEAWREVLPQAA